MFKKSAFGRFSNLLFELPIIIYFPFLSFLALSKKISNQEPYTLILICLIISFVFSTLLIYSIVNIYSLKRIKGLSRGKNRKIINEIVKTKGWEELVSNQQMTAINFSWRLTGTDWGKQMTILYDEDDILVNCISFGLFSSPSPFHWFANKKKVTELEISFLRKINNSSS